MKGFSSQGKWAQSQQWGLQLLDKSPRLGWGLALMWVLGLSWLAFGWQLGAVGLVDETEPLFAEASRQMYETGDWITPVFNGEPRYDKPPLVYWLMAIGFHLWTVNEWTVRLPSALAAIAMVGLVFVTLLRFGLPRPNLIPQAETEAGLRLHQRRTTVRWVTALAGSAIVAMTPQTIAWGRMGVSDMLLTVGIVSALLTFFWGYATPREPQKTYWYLAAYGCLGLAVLAKGPVGLVLPGLIVIAFALYVGQFRVLLREMRILPGLLLVGVMTLPWNLLMVLANGQDYIDSFFIYHNVERFTSVVNNHAAPWFFYFLVVAVGFLPWSPFLPLAMGRLQFWRWQHWRQQPRETHLGIFALSWFWVIFGFFTVAVTKLPSYVLPLMPAAGILVALAWGDRSLMPAQPPLKHWGFWASVGATLLAVVALAGVSFYSPNWLGDDPGMPGLPERVRASGAMIRATWIWAIAALAMIILLWRRQSRWLWLVNLVAFTAFLGLSILPVYGLADLERHAPLRSIAATINAQQQPGEEIYMLAFKKPTLVFYTQQPVVYLETRELIQDWQANLPETALVVGTESEINSWVRSQPLDVTVLDAHPVYQLVRAELQP
jgi:4-amino-4-deoxy-L-arabinose transferase-like glycosyltransferase